MTLYNYIRRRSHDDVIFAEFDRNPNFIYDDIYLMLLHAQEAMKTIVFFG
jgi:hypothetical protein